MLIVVVILSILVVMLSVIVVIHHVAIKRTSNALIVLDSVFKKLITESQVGRNGFS
jgi:uncharacterized membrane protein YqiK